jgi:hypothetical protein
VPGRRRGRALWIAAALVAALIAGLIVFWAVALDDADPSAQNPPSATSSSSAATTSEEAGETSDGGGGAEETGESTSASASTTTSANADPLSAANIQSFLASYHEQVLTDPRAAYARTGPTLRAAISEENYVQYWSQFSDVRLSDIQATDGNNVARATMELVYTDGSSEVAGHTFTFVVQGDQLILDSDFQD